MRTTCTTLHLATIPVDLVTTRVLASKPRIFARNSVSVPPSARTGSPAVAAKRSVIPSSVLAILLYENAIQICVRLAEQTSSMSLKFPAKMSASSVDCTNIF